MRLDRTQLGDHAPRIVRVVGEDLLANVRKSRERLQAGDDSKALHDFRVAVRRLRSWLRAFGSELEDTLPSKATRRLERIADATRASRDLEVHIAWVEKFAHSRRGAVRKGAGWLAELLQSRKAESDFELQQVLHDEIDRVLRAVAKAFDSYVVTTHKPLPPFGRVAARLIREHAEQTRTALGNVATVGDRAEGHEARIAAKRLRYLLEPLGDSIDQAPALITQLSRLQDQLGALHDAQLFGSEIARELAKLLTGKKKKKIPDSETTRSAGSDDDRVTALLAISRRLHRDEEAGFARVKKDWLSDTPLPIWAEIESAAETLGSIASEGREIERKYLLRGMVQDAPPGLVLEIDQGYLAGTRLVERVRRVRGAGKTRHFRTVKVGSGIDRFQLEEPATRQVFNALWPLTEGRRVRKRRHQIEFDGYRWEIDEFLDRDLVLAEVEIEDAEDAVAIPDWLEPFIDRDVTEEREFSNRSLAK